jgi:hypothetical protein
MNLNLSPNTFAGVQVAWHDDPNAHDMVENPF